MNKFVFSALATTLVGATGFANDTEWPELDRELAALSNAPLTQDSGGPTVSGWLIGAIASDDSPSNNNPAANVNDNLSTGVAAARVNLSGSLGSNYHFVLGWDFTDIGELYAPSGVPVGSTFNATTITFDPTSGLGGLTDAYVKFGVADGLDIQIGAFNPMFLRSSSIQRNRTIFINRSFLGGMYSSRDAGVGLSGNFDRLNWEVTGTNGHDGTQDSFAYSFHLDLDILGSSSGNEGAYNSTEGTTLNIGATYTDDSSDTTANDDLLDNGLTDASLPLGTSRDAGALGVYATLTTSGFTVWGELVDQDNDVTGAGYVGPAGQGATPWSAGLAYLFASNYEVAFRYDDWDNAINTTRINVGVNRYVDGHDIKWQLNFATGSDDVPGGGIAARTDNTVIALGIAAGF